MKDRNARKNKQTVVSFDILSLLHNVDTNKWNEVVRNYSISTDRDDFFRFVLFLKENCNVDNAFGRTCREKLNECKQRAEVIYADDPQLARLLRYDKYVQRLHKIKAVISIVIGLVMVIAFSLFLVATVSKCNREKREKKIESERLTRIAIDNEYEKLDSVVSSLPKPTKRNYEQCASQVKSIMWGHVSCDWDSELYKYQRKKAEMILCRVNIYILSLQKIEPLYIDYQHEMMYDKNPMYVETKEMWEFF